MHRSRSPPTACREPIEKPETQDHGSRPAERTTLIFNNLPDGFSRNKVAELLISQGFAKKFNFIYTPTQLSTMRTYGYAFVNMVSPEVAEECRSQLNGFSAWEMPCDNVLCAVWSDKDQGLTAIIDRHRNSPIMHKSIVNEEVKPALYTDGVKIAFPKPTKSIRAPRMEHRSKKWSTQVSGNEEF